MNKSILEYFAQVKGNNTYLMGDSVDDRKRLALQVKLTAPGLKKCLSKALDKYGLREKLHNPNATFRVIDLGCGEGLYIPVLQEFFQEQGAKARITIVGVDRDELAIATAQDYMAALGIRNAEFYIHDLTYPLTQLDELDLTQPENHFDLAFSLVTLMHLVDIPRILRSIHAVLKPGGAFYTKDVSLTESVIYPSPAFIQIGKMMSALMSKMIGDDFALRHQEYLSLTDFEQIETFETRYVLGGTTEDGRRALEDMLLGQHAFRAAVSKFGIMKEADYDKLMEQEFREIRPDLEGSITTINSIARRPLI